MEILVVLAALLLLFGAQRMPGIARQLGKALEDLRRTARDVTDELKHADREIRSDLPSPPPPDNKKDDGKQDYVG